jgi:hypothetical protein
MWWRTPSQVLLRMCRKSQTNIRREKEKCVSTPPQHLALPWFLCPDYDSFIPRASTDSLHQPHGVIWSSYHHSSQPLIQRSGEWGSKTRYIFRAKETAIWNMIYYYPPHIPHLWFFVLIVSLVHRACLMGHNEEETSKPLLFSTRTWSKFETSNPDRLVGPLKFDNLFFAQNPSLSCSVWISNLKNCGCKLP